MSKNDWVFESNEFQFVINDRMDVCIKLTKQMNMGFLNQLIAKKQKANRNQGDRKNERVSRSIYNLGNNETTFNKAYYF